MQPLIRIVLFVSVVLLSGAGAAPREPASGSPARQSLAPTPVPLAQVPFAAQSALASLQEIDTNISRDQASTNAAALTLSELTGEIDSRIGDDTRLLTMSASLEILYQVKLTVSQVRAARTLSTWA